MKSKNLPKRQKPKARNKRGKKTYFNPWICKYFDLSGHGLEKEKGGKMNDSIIIYKSRNHLDGDKTYEYDLQIRSGMTLSEFTHAILEDADEWGIIEARINGRPIAKIRYSDGKIEDVFTPDDPPLLSPVLSPYRCTSEIGTYHVKDLCKAFGKGRRMDYIVLLEEKRK